MESTDIAVLIVEDNPNDAELTLRALRGLVGPERLLLIEDGVRAAEHLSGNGGRPPRFILLDLKLPRMDGLELLRRIRAEPRTQPVPVVVLTSSREEHDLRESYRLGANSYLVKPVGFQEYVALVAQAGRYWLELNQLPLAPS